MAKLYPHLTVEIDLGFLTDGLVQEYKTLTNTQHFRRIYLRDQMYKRYDDAALWLVEHGYQCGRDYQRSDDGYRFASESLATMFVRSEEHTSELQSH